MPRNQPVNYHGPLSEAEELHCRETQTVCRRRRELDAAADTACEEVANEEGCLLRFASKLSAAFNYFIPNGGILSGAFNMASSSIGAGILGLPAAADTSGLLMAVLYLIIITFFSIFSMYLLAIAARRSNIRSFEGMARYLFPRWNHAFSYFAAFIRWFHAFAGCVAYIISVGNCFAPIFNQAREDNPSNAAIKYFASRSGNRVLTVCVWIVIMLPLVIPKHIDSLRYASTFAVSFMVYFALIVIVESCRNGLPKHRHNVKVSASHGDPVGDDIFLFRTGNSAINGVGVFMFAYVCQLNAIEVWWDMRPEIRNPLNYTVSATIGMLLCGILYVLVCVFGYFDFGSKAIKGNSLLLMYNPLREPQVMVAYVGVMIKLCAAYGVLTVGARNSLYYIIGWQHKYRVQQEEKDASEVVFDAPPSKAAPAFDGPADAPSSAEDGSAPPLRHLLSNDSLDDLAAAAMANTAEDTLFVDLIPWWQHLVAVLLLSGASLLCGLFIPDINTVFGFAGAISGGFLAFIFPALFVMYAGNFTVKSVGMPTFYLTYALLICGVVGIVFGTGGTIYETI